MPSIQGIDGGEGDIDGSNGGGGGGKGGGGGGGGARPGHESGHDSRMSSPTAERGFNSSGGADLAQIGGNHIDGSGGVGQGRAAQHARAGARMRLARCEELFQHELQMWVMTQGPWPRSIRKAAHHREPPST